MASGEEYPILSLASSSNGGFSSNHPRSRPLQAKASADDPSPTKWQRVPGPPMHHERDLTRVGISRTLIGCRLLPRVRLPRQPGQTRDGELAEALAQPASRHSEQRSCGRPADRVSQCLSRWPSQMRGKRKHRLLAFGRFLICPTLRCRDLTSKVLGIARCPPPAGCAQRYSYGPLLLKINIDGERHTDTSLWDANRALVGSSAGRRTPSISTLCYTVGSPTVVAVEVVPQTELFPAPRRATVR